MNILVLKPKLNTLSHHLLVDGDSQPALEGTIQDYRIGNIGKEKLAELAEKIGEIPAVLDAIGIRVPFGGTAFPEPTLVTPEVIEKIRDLTPQSPLHLSGVLALIDACARVFPGLPVGLVFETSFFTKLPPREFLYAINAELTPSSELRRFGYHGLFHETAALQVMGSGRTAGRNGPPRILSICLEPRPEVAAVIGTRPVYVTSGTTPLEGLPGQTICGELDPNIVIELAKKKKWGPEQINDVLTRKSGLMGLVGQKTSLPRIFASTTPEGQLAANIIRYRILQAAGMAAAAMGGIDVIVFSGRYHRVGKTLAESIIARFESLNPANAGMKVESCLTPLEQIIADSATTLVLKNDSLARAV